MTRTDCHLHPGECAAACVPCAEADEAEARAALVTALRAAAEDLPAALLAEAFFFEGGGSAPLHRRRAREIERDVEEARRRLENWALYVDACRDERARRSMSIEQTHAADVVAQHTGRAA